MPKYSVPDNIRSYKPKGTMIKALNGKYYVYNYSCVKDPSSGKWKTKMGSLIGTIKEGIGFVPNSTFIENEVKSIYEYGQYYSVFQNTQNVLDDLKNYFNPQDATELYLISLIIFVNGFSGFTNIEEQYKQSYLSIKYPDIHLSYYNINKLLDAVGRRQDRVINFQNYLITKSNQMAIDGHSFVSYSKKNDLTEFGNKYQLTKEAQYNMLTAYDIESSMPIFAKAYSGSSLDKVAIKDLLSTFKLKKKLIIVDCGFFSKENIKLIAKNNSYIIPLSKNLSDYKEVVDSIDYKNSFIYSANKKKDPVYYVEKSIDDGKSKVIVFKNMTINALEQGDFKKKIGTSSLYTEEKFQEIKDYFGIIVLQTNLNESAEYVYTKYKKRWKIETFFDYMKNKLEIDATNEQSFYIIQALTFLTVIIGLINKYYSDVALNVKESTNDLLTKCRFVKIQKKGNDFEIGNYNNKIKTLFESINCVFDLKVQI